MIFFRHLTEWIFIFLDSQALNARKLRKNPLSNFREAGLAKPIFASEAGLSKMRKSDIFSENALHSVFFQKYHLESCFNIFFRSSSVCGQHSMYIPLMKRLL